MSAETMILLFVIGCAPPLTLFPFYFGWVARGIWYRNFPGFAIMISTTSLAALMDLTLAYRVWGDYPYREQILVAVLAGIFAGAWLKFVGLIYESRKGSRSHRGRRPMTRNEL